MSVEHKSVFSCVLLCWDTQNCSVQCCMHRSTHFTILCVTFFNSAASMNPFPSLRWKLFDLYITFLQNIKESNLSNILKASLSSAELSWCSAWKLNRGLSMLYFWYPLFFLICCIHWTCFRIISMNSSKSSFPFPLTSYSMTRLSTCRLIRGEMRD